MTESRVVRLISCSLKSLLAAAICAASLNAQSPFDSLHFRSIGPAATGGRIHDVEVDPKDQSTIYVAAASGGIWKTVNHGTMWTPIFEGQPDNTFGSIAIFDGDSKIVWAGSGEQNNRQSSSWGGGIYKSIDGGKTWSHMGLTQTRSIAKVVLHPTDANIAYVAADGNLWKANPERGVFKTTDGGVTWKKILYVDTLTGATDLVMDPRDPNVLYAATYQHIRSAFGYNGGGPGSAIYKSMDAGSTWNKLENGIPSGDKGRIALALAKSNPNVLVAEIEHATESGTYRSEDAGATWRRVSRNNPRPMYFSAVYIDPTNDQRVWELGVTIYKSEDGGATFENMPNSPTYDVGLKTDHHTMWIDPRDSRHTLVGGDGGLHESWDLGITYRKLNEIPIGQFYHIAVDDRDPYWIYGGLQDTHSWMGPSATRHWLGILNQDWKQIGFSDGTGQAVDKAGWRYVYTESDGGNVQRFDPETGDRLDIKPEAPKGEPPYRWDWNAPLIASQHTPGTVYLGANRLFISHDMGVTWTRTKDLTRQVNRDTIMLGGVLDKDVKISKNDGESSFSAITTVDESPIDAKVLWVGANDGNVEVSTDGGATWKETSGAIRGVPNGTYVSQVRASSANRGTAYVSFDGHRSGDFAPYIVRTTDFGKTWTPITSGLPADQSVRTVYEYPGKGQVVFAGTERHLFVSTDSGAHFTQITANLPTTRYDDMVIQPRTKDLVIGTHGRAIWILDDASPIADYTSAVTSKPASLFPVRRATLLWYWEDISNTAQGMYTAENPAEGAAFTYALSKPAQNVRLVVRGPDGKVIREIKGSTNAGVLHRTNWDLRHDPPPASAMAGGFGGEEGAGPIVAEGAPAGGGGRGGRGGGGGGRGRATGPAPLQLPIPTHDIGNRGPYVAPGTYKVTLDVDGDTTSRTFEVRGDPMSTATLAQQKAREVFLMSVQDLQIQIEKTAADIQSKRATASGADADKLTALYRRLTGGRTSPRAALRSISTFYNGTGAQQGSWYPPTAQMKAAYAEAKTELAAVQKEAK